MNETPGTPTSVLTRGRVILLLIVGALGFVGYTVYDNLDRWGIKRTETWTVSEHSWRRTIGVEQRGTWREDEWCDHMRLRFADATDVKRTRQKRGTKKVFKRRNCRGSGADQRCTDVYENKDVMANRCAFTWEGWKEQRKSEASGTNLEPEWATPTYAADEREGKRIELYWVALTMDGEVQKCAKDEALWRRFAVGSSLSVQSSYRFGNLDCAALSP